MALREEFEGSGRWLFRWRGYLPLALFLPVIAGLAESPGSSGGVRADMLWEALCATVSVLGLAIRIATIARTPGGTSGRQTVRGPWALALNTSGMYSVVRHPLYLGNAFQWLGVAMLARSPWVVVTVSLTFWLYYERIMFAEEEYLRRAFGADFVAWAAETPAFIPDFARWKPASLPFCWRTAIRREYSGVFALVAAFAIVCMADDTIDTHRLTINPFWFTALVLGTITYVTVRLVARRTRLLCVRGR